MLFCLFKGSFDLVKAQNLYSSIRIHMNFFINIKYSKFSGRTQSDSEYISVCIRILKFKYANIASGYWTEMRTPTVLLPSFFNNTVVFVSNTNKDDIRCKEQSL